MTLFPKFSVSFLVSSCSEPDPEVKDESEPDPEVKDESEPDSNPSDLLVCKRIMTLAPTNIARGICLGRAPIIINRNATPATIVYRRCFIIANRTEPRKKLIDKVSAEVGRFMSAVIMFIYMAS
jgi:hypothetical protein